jgi:RNA polymerase sigma-70 factor (ECF subfamily)
LNLSNLPRDLWGETASLRFAKRKRSAPGMSGMTSADTTSLEQERLCVRAAQRGDTDAFCRLVDSYDRRVLYFILRFLPDAHQALDVLQDVWLTLLRRLPELRAPEAFRVWLYQIAHDKVVTLLRRQRREKQAHEALLNHRREEAGGHELTVEHAELVHRGLERLSAEHREVLTLRFLEGLSLEEIAEAVRCNLGTVKSRLHYARQALRHCVEKLSHA